MAENKVLFVINKYSGTGFRDSVEGRIIDACARLDLEGTIEYTQHKGHATELARQAVKAGFPRVFAMGGDGTVNEVAQGLVHSQTALGILPKGSGNGLARHLGIPLRIHNALRLLDRHQVITMDTFSVNQRLSVNVSGIGFDAHVASKFGKDGKRGLIGYGKLIMQEFLKFREFPMKINVDGKAMNKKIFILALANSSQFGNNAKVAPHASVCDQLIDVCMIKKVPITRAVDFARRMFTGYLNGSRFVDILHGKHIHLKFTKPMPFHIDGESMEPESEFDIKVEAGSLRVIVPLHTRKKL
jgi:diacylglycerol kinase (ATP)